MYVEDDINDPLLAPLPILNLYLKQLFPHITRDVPTLERVNPRTWVSVTTSSYQLWLSYAKLGIPSDLEKKREEGCRVTECTQVHEERLDKASKEEIDSYVKSVFPESYAEPWKRVFPDDQIKFFISRVHFWFFVSHPLDPPLPRHTPPPRTPKDMFRHPLFFMEKYKESLPFVVPEYYFNGGAAFDGLENPETASYYIFPYFAQKLFEYVMTPRNERGTSFTAYYLVREPAWFVPAGFDTSRLIKSHGVLRRNWSWEDVLEMLWNRKVPGEKRHHPRWCQSAPHDYQHNPEIKAYLDCFARVAEVWEIERRQVNA